MGLVEVVTDVSNCNARQEMNAPIIIGAGGSFTSGNIDCSKDLTHTGGQTDLTVGLKGGKGKKLNLMNLGFIGDFGNGLQTASKYGAQAYKVGKQVAPVAGDAMQYVAPETYKNYAIPVTNDFLAAKEFGKSKGGWGAVDAFGQELAGAPVGIILLNI